MKVMRKIIRIDEELCNGCGECVPGCAEAALEIVDNKAKLVAEKYCDGLGACLGECPTGALTLEEREVDDFDEKAVEELLMKKKAQEKPAQTPPPGGCPSAKIQSFQGITPCQSANIPRMQPAGSSGSALSHWPVKIRLVPPQAPFLKNADLLVAADCAPFAYPAFHQEFLAGRVLMSGCPKFDETGAYIEKFAEIFQNAGLRSITAVIMEVPCCGSMKMIISEALKKSGAKIPVEVATISARGEVIRRENLAAS